MSCRLRIGLTGGIGSGKSEASRQFSRLGVPVIDTDTIARELVEPGQPALTEIVSVFGDEILDNNTGHLDRSRLRERIFSDPAQRRKLEQILHSRIRDRALGLARTTSAPYCILVIPLLAETGQDYALDRVLVIDAPRELQIARATARDNLSRTDVEQILASQASREQRLKLADDIVVNDGTLADLARQIDRLHHVYLELASSGDSGRESAPAK
jgi:dephospho-CoA kinase